MATLRLHLAPGLEARENPLGATIVDETRNELARIAGEGIPFLTDRSPYHPEFGVGVERTLLTAALPFRDRLEVDWAIEPAPTTNLESS